MSTSPPNLPAGLPPKWRERFDFFDRYGPLNQPAAKAAFKELSFGKRLLVNFSWLGFFFGPIYWFILGMWRRALVWIAIVFVIGILESLIGAAMPAQIFKALTYGVGFAISAITGQATNYCYYLKEVKDDNGWNPFKGLRL